jgi:hypothetical protein
MAHPTEPPGPGHLRPTDEYPDDLAADPELARRVDRTDHSPWNWLLLVPLVLTLFPPLYNRLDPGLGGIPFFYWYQLLVIPVGVLATVVVYRKTRA